MTSGSGYGAVQSSPHSASQNASQSLPVTTQAALEPLCQDLERLKEGSQRLEETLARITDDFEGYKVGVVHAGRGGYKVGVVVGGGVRVGGGGAQGG